MRAAIAAPAIQQSAKSDNQGPVLVLGAGGARGLAHIGVLQALEYLGIHPYAIVGSSMGAQVGTAYAFGISPQAMEDMALRTGRKETLSVILSGKNRRQALHSLYGDKDLRDTQIPVCVVATDLENGAPVLLKTGPAIDTVSASISIPGVFPAFPYQGRMLIDGAMSLPLPVSVAKALYPGRKIIAVSVCHSHLEDVAPRAGRLRTLQRSMQIMHRNMILSHIENFPPDVLITPTIPDVDALDLHKADDVIHTGYTAALAAIRLSPNFSELSTM